MATQKQTKKTFSNQSSLPFLPVGDFRVTFEKYLDSVKALVSEEQFNNTKKNVEKFLAPGGDGERLQTKLLQWAKSQEAQGKSWLDDWWLQFAYLMWKSPLPLNSNIYAIFDKEVSKETWNQARQAARYADGWLNFKDNLEREEHPPEYIMRKYPMCMQQYVPLFTCVRNPGKELDTLVTIKPNQNVLVICRKQFYLVPVYHENGKRLSADDLEQLLQEVIDDSKRERAPVYGMGVLTAVERDTWANVREKLLQDPTNRRILEEIEKTIFVIALDPEPLPDEYDEAAPMALVGDANNRWYDKVIQLIVYANGRLGYNAEHTPADAIVHTGAMDETGKKFISYWNKNPPVHYSPRSSLPQVRKLHWKYSPEIEGDLIAADQEYTKMRKDCDQRLLHFCDFGSEEIKRLGFSPDTFMQMALQLGYTRLHNAPAATYETATTRMFLHGRTETVRSCSTASVKWTKAMLDPSASPALRLSLMKDAFAAHKKYMTDATMGKGADRHLLGLRILANQEVATGESKELPELFTDPSFSQSTYYRMSTSNVPTSGIFGGFGNMYPDGYGCCYHLLDNEIRTSIVSRHACPTTSSYKLRDAIAQSLREMRQLGLLQSSNAKL